MNYKKQGVTLIELLVVIVTSAIVLSSVVASFASLVGVVEKIDVSRQLQKEIHFALVRVADSMRAYGIDYEAYEGGDCMGQSKESATKVCFGNGFVFEKKKRENREHSGFFMNGEPLFSSVFHVNDVNVFDITPREKDDMKNYQPKVTIYLDVVSRQYPDISFQIQTTISSRVYNQ